MSKALKTNWQKPWSYQATGKQLVWLHRLNSSVWSGSLIHSVSLSVYRAWKSSLYNNGFFLSFNDKSRGTAGARSNSSPSICLRRTSCHIHITSHFHNTSCWLENMCCAEYKKDTFHGLEVGDVLGGTHVCDVREAVFWYVNLTQVCCMWMRPNCVRLYSGMAV